MSHDAFEQYLKRQGYRHVRRLEDGSYAALIPLLYTVGLCMGLDAEGWAYRFCFEDPQRGLEELNKLKTVQDVPSGWLARRYGDTPVSARL